MRKWIVVTLMAVICLLWLVTVSADTGFTITETGTNQMTMFKNAGIMQCSTYFNVLFNDTGLAASAGYALALTNVFDGSSGGVHKEHLRVHVPSHDCVVYRARLVRP